MAMKVSAYKKLKDAENARMGGSLADAGAMTSGAKIVQYNGMSLLRAAELQQGRENEAAPRSAERNEGGEKNGDAGLHDFTSKVLSGDLI